MAGLAAAARAKRDGTPHESGTEVIWLNPLRDAFRPTAAAKIRSHGCRLTGACCTAVGRRLARLLPAAFQPAYVRRQGKSRNVRLPESRQAGNVCLPAGRRREPKRRPRKTGIRRGPISATRAGDARYRPILLRRSTQRPARSAPAAITRIRLPAGSGTVATLLVS